MQTRSTERDRETENLQDTYHVQQDQPGSTEACKRLVELENYRINFCSHDWWQSNRHRCINHTTGQIWWDIIYCRISIPLRLNSMYLKKMPKEFSYGTFKHTSCVLWTQCPKIRINTKTDESIKTLDRIPHCQEKRCKSKTCRSWDSSYRMSRRIGWNLQLQEILWILPFFSFCNCFQMLLPPPKKNPPFLLPTKKLVRT